MSIFHPAHVSVSLDKTGDTYSYLHCYVVLDNTPDITIEYNSYSNRYTLFARKVNMLANVSHQQKIKAQKAYNKPNNIGVLSLNKLRDHINYWTKVYDDPEALDKANAQCIQEFRDSIALFTVNWHKEGQSGCNIRNGVEFSFEIKDGCISENLKLHYSVTSSIESFKKLSNNSYSNPLPQ